MIRIHPLRAGLVLGLTLLSSCVTQSKYDAKVAEAEDLQAQLAEAKRAHAEDEQAASELAKRLEVARTAQRQAQAQGDALLARIEEEQRRAAGLQQALMEREASVADLQQQLEAQKKVLAEFQALADAYGANTPEDLERALAQLRKRVDETEAALRKASMELARERRISEKLSALIDSGKLRVTRRSGRLVIELPGDIHFASGSAKLTEVGSATLQELAPVLEAESDRLFVVEGHTDNVPISVSGFRSNWHLGGNRAEVAREALTQAGLPPQRVAIASWADLLPACPEVNDPACRAKNRRVAVVLLPMFQ